MVDLFSKGFLSEGNFFGWILTLVGIILKDNYPQRLDNSKNELSTVSIRRRLDGFTEEEETIRNQSFFTGRIRKNRFFPDLCG